MPSVRRHVWIDASPDAVWAALRDTPRHEYNPQMTSSSRSKDGTIFRDDWTTNYWPAVRGDVLTFTTYSQLIECDDDLRRLRVHLFVTEGSYDFHRPLPYGDDVYDVLEASDGCILVASQTDIPDSRMEGFRLLYADRVRGLKEYCEKNRSTDN